jgi:hypothetical protein
MTNSRIVILGTISDINAFNNQRTSAGIILDTDNTQIILDPGTGTVFRSTQANADLRRTNIILISSTESVYCNDINAVIEHTNRDIHLICPKELLKHDEHILTSHHAKNLKTITVDDSEHKQTNIKGIDIEAQHTKAGSVSYKITTSRYVLGYITKAKYSKEFINSFKDTNILIINLHSLKHEKNSKYLDLEEITVLIEEINPELVIFNGFSKKILDADPLDISRKIKQKLQENRDKPIKTQILPAKELMIINPEAYNIKLKQKNLKGFFG